MSLKYVICRRLLLAVPAVISVVLINFFIVHLAPGDPAVLMAGEEAPFDYIEMLRAKWGLDKPLHEQFLIYLSAVFHGDLGYSYRYQMPVFDLIMERLPATFILVGTALLLATIGGVFLGVVAARKPFSKTDQVVSVISVICYSMPIFWFGLLLILFFALYLRLFPVQGMCTLGGEMPGIHGLTDLLWHLALPALTLTVVELTKISRLARSSVLEEIRKDYIITAKGKGLSERVVLYKHALRNALRSIVTITALRLQMLFTGAILTETVFAWPGMGRLIYDSITARDYPLLMGTFLIAAIIIIISNLIADISYVFLDPRVRYR